MRFKRRRKVNKQILLTQLFLVLLLFIGIGYSILNTNLGINGTVQLNKHEEYGVLTCYNDYKLFNVIKCEAEEGTLAKKYNGAHNDNLTGAEDNDIYYFTTPTEDDITQANQLKKLSNVKVGNFCWQMLRTTDSGGVKLIYNGEYDETNKCNNKSQKSIGTSKFNAKINLPSYVGYMYNSDVATTSGDQLETSLIEGNLYGNDITYSNEKYTLINTSTTLDVNHHYGCDNTTGSCEDVKYYYSKVLMPNSSIRYYYLILKNGENISETLYNMLYADDVNKSDSEIKKYIEDWYQNNMTIYSSYLEDVIYCNDRSQSNKNTNGFNLNGNLSNGEQISFSSESGISLNCPNVTDQFTTKNPKAKLKYPIGLATSPELRLVNNRFSLITETPYWVLSPSEFVHGRVGNYDGATVTVVNDTGYITSNNVTNTVDVRPVISLKSEIEYINGYGSMNCPYIIEGDEESVDHNCSKNDSIDNYNKVEYIESDGSSYIDTDVTLDAKYTFESEGLIPSGKSGSFIDGYESNSARQGLLFNNTSSNRFAYYWFGVGNTFVNLADTGIDMSNRFKVVQNSNGVTLTQGNNSLSKTYSGYNSGGTDATINLLRQVQNSYAGYARLYSAKIKEGDTVIHNYIPVTRKSDGTVGVYDTVDNEFLTNSGSGSFSKGENIN